MNNTQETPRNNVKGSAKRIQDAAKARARARIQAFIDTYTNGRVDEVATVRQLLKAGDFAALANLTYRYVVDFGESAQEVEAAISVAIDAAQVENFFGVQ